MWCADWRNFVNASNLFQELEFETLESRLNVKWSNEYLKNEDFRRYVENYCLQNPKKHSRWI
jgi:hypothetical protein